MHLLQVTPQTFDGLVCFGGVLCVVFMLKSEKSGFFFGAIHYFLKPDKKPKFQLRKAAPKCDAVVVLFVVVAPNISFGIMAKKNPTLVSSDHYTLFSMVSGVAPQKSVCPVIWRWQVQISRLNTVASQGFLPWHCMKISSKGCADWCHLPWRTRWSPPCVRVELSGVGNRCAIFSPLVDYCLYSVPWCIQCLGTLSWFCKLLCTLGADHDFSRWMLPKKVSVNNLSTLLLSFWCAILANISFSFETSF